MMHPPYSNVKMNNGKYNGMDVVNGVYKEDSKAVIRDTLEFDKENLQKRGRRKGNTTRQAELAVRWVLRGYNVLINDHFENGHNRMANELLLDLVIEKLNKKYPIFNVVIKRIGVTPYLVPNIIKKKL